MRKWGGGGGIYTCMPCYKSYRPDEVYLLDRIFIERLFNINSIKK
jgi:hypothetical protein